MIIKLYQNFIFHFVTTNCNIGFSEDSSGTHFLYSILSCISNIGHWAQSVLTSGHSDLKIDLSGGFSLFSLYTTPLSKIIRLYPHIKFHFYADDTQLYIHLSHKNASSALAKLNACLRDVQEWMSLNKLKLNPEKTEFIVFGSKAQRQKISSHFPVSILGSLLHPVDSV